MAKKFTLSTNESYEIKSNSIVEYITRCGFNLYYDYDEIFKYVEDRRDLFGESFSFVDDKVGTYKATFLKDYIHSVKENPASVFPIKLLVDTLLYHPTRTVFCFYDGVEGLFNISKGTKKLIAFDILGLMNAHVLIVSKNKLPNQIKSDEELYWLLRKIDPLAHRFDIIIDSNTFPKIHYAESVSTIGKWSMMNEVHHEIFKVTMPNIPARVKFIGKAYTTDDRIVECNDDYYCCVYSDRLVDISLDYLYLCSSNMFYKEKTRIGNTRDSSVVIEYGWTNHYPAGYADFFIPDP